MTLDRKSHIQNMLGIVKSHETLPKDIRGTAASLEVDILYDRVGEEALERDYQNLQCRLCDHYTLPRD